MRPLSQRLQRQGFNGNGRATERPYNRYSSRSSGTDALPLDTLVRPYTGYTSDPSDGSDGSDSSDDL